MKYRYALLLILFFATYAVKAQVINNLVVFCNEGEPFTLILNGLKENQTPQTNVRVTGLDLKVYQVKVIFANHKIKDHNSTITFFRTGKECVFALNKKGSKKHTLDYVSEKEIDGFLDPATQQAPVNNTTTEVQTLTSLPVTTNNTGSGTSQFQIALNTIAQQPTEADKLNTAVALLNSNTFSVAQIKGMFTLFSTEQSKVTFAKEVLAQAKDPAVYSEIINAFMTNSVKTELQKFIYEKK